MYRDNLIKLRDFASSYPQDKFDMAAHFHDEKTDKRCLIGLTDLIFGEEISYADLYDLELYESLFLGWLGWSKVDNTTQGAVNRINWLLDGKDIHDYILPDGKTYEEISAC